MSDNNNRCTCAAHLAGGCVCGFRWGGWASLADDCNDSVQSDLTSLRADRDRLARELADALAQLATVRAERDEARKAIDALSEALSEQADRSATVEHERDVFLARLQEVDAEQLLAAMDAPPAMTGPVDALERVLELEDKLQAAEAERDEAALRELAVVGRLAKCESDTAERIAAMAEQHAAEFDANATDSSDWFVKAARLLRDVAADIRADKWRQKEDS